MGVCQVLTTQNFIRSISGMNTKQQVLSLATGEHSLEVIASRVGVSRQRVHQILKSCPEALEIRKRFLGGKRMDRKLARSKRDKETRDTLYGGMSKKDFMSCPLRAQQFHKLSEKRTNARRQNIECTIRWSDLEWPTHCPITGIELDYYNEKREQNSPTFDRVDSTKGYVPGNVAILSARANRIKDNGTAEEHRKIADYIDRMSKSVIATVA